MRDQVMQDVACTVRDNVLTSAGACKQHHAGMHVGVRAPAGDGSPAVLDQDGPPLSRLGNTGRGM